MTSKRILLCTIIGISLLLFLIAISFQTEKLLSPIEYSFPNHQNEDLPNKTLNEKSIEIITENPIPPKENLKYISLTFDDGPKIGRTDEIIEILNEYKMNATFFMLGLNIKAYPGLVSFVLENGNEIGSHTYDHKYLTKISKPKIHYEIEETNALFNSITGEDFILLRPPYGHLNDYVRTNYNYSYILWSLDPRDWEIRDAKAISEYILENIEEGDIILLHDTYLTTVEALRILLPELKAREFQSVTISELAKIKNKTIESYTVYKNFK